jgi:uncharacterized membrane protein
LRAISKPRSDHSPDQNGCVEAVQRENTEMSHRAWKSTSRFRSIVRTRLRAWLRCPVLERLEDRLMLDSGIGSSTPASIVVGRTLSSYFVGGIQKGQETITYTVYNEQADPETGVLLTTTLQPGVSFAGASLPPDQSGQNLAWSLGTIQGFDRASVSVTVTLPSTVPTQLDSGAHAYATLDAAAVSNTTPAATLRPGNVSDPSLLVGMPDPSDPLASSSDQNDPFIQEEAAKLDYDPTQIFNFLHTQIGYNSYYGSLRGARGTLWSNAGNSLDVANLGVALMRASGIPAQYVSGTLSFSQAQSLILSMFPASYRSIGSIPAGTQVSDPSENGQLLSETEQHYWFQFNAGSGFQNADPLMAGATIGQTFTTATGTFTQIPDNLRQKTEVKLNAEIYSQASALFGLGGGLSTSTVLDETFNDAELAGRSLTFGNFVNVSSIGALVFSSTTNSYTPYVEIGDQAYPDPSRDELITGTQYQEVYTNFPLGSQVLTGLFLDVKLSGSDTTDQTYERAIVDQIGYAARQGLDTANVSASASATPAVGPFDLYTLSVNTGLQDPNTLSPLAVENTNAFAVAASDASTTAQEADALVSLGNAQLASYQVAADHFASTTGANALVLGYHATPGLSLFKTSVDDVGGTTPTPVFRLDLVEDGLYAIAYPGQATNASIGYNEARGYLDSALESVVLSTDSDATGSGAIVTSAFSILQAATSANIPFVTITNANLGVLSSLSIPDEAKARITTAVQAGLSISVPSTTVMVNGTPSIAWWQVDPTTGDTIAVMQDGGHQATIEYSTTTDAEGLQIAVLRVKLFGKTIFKKTFPSLQQAMQFGGKLKRLVNFGGRAGGAAGGLTGLLAGDITVAALGILLALANIDDPPLTPGTLFDPVSTELSNPQNLVTAPVVVPPVSRTTETAGTASVSNAVVSGPLTASWSSSSQTSFTATAFAANVAQISSPSGFSGSGSVSINSMDGFVASIVSSGQYSVTGSGSLSFYGPAESNIGVSGDWSNYMATVAGNSSITLTTLADGDLTLNGQPLPAGTYTITTTGAALGGSGATSSPNFAGTVGISATAGVIQLGPGSGNVSVGGKAIDPTNEATLTGFNGTVIVTGNANGTDTVALNGNAGNVIQVSAGAPTLTTDQNTPVDFAPAINTTFGDTYNLTVSAPDGWKVSIGSSGQVSVSPLLGLQGGTYPIHILAQSTTDPDLVAQTTVNVTITPTKPGINFTAAPDPQFTVPFGGAQLPTAFRASIQNLGPAADTYNLTFSGIPSGFTLLNSGTSVTVPAGQTGILGLALQPNAGQALPAPGTVLSFKVTATSKTTATITKTQTVSFTVPAIDAVTVTGSPTTLGTTPGAGVTETLTFANVGNVPETVTLSDALSAGLSAGALTALTLAVGQTLTETVTLTPASSTPLNSQLQATFTATYGPTASPQTQTLTVPVQVVAPGVGSVSGAATAALNAGNTGLGNQLSDLTNALSALYQDPTDPVANSQATASLESLISQVTTDPFLTTFTAGLTAARTAIASATTAAEVQAALTNLGTALTALAHDVTDEAASGFTLSLSPDREVVLPSAPEVFTLVMKNNGKVATTYNLAVSGLPAGVTSAFSQKSVTLQPGASIGPGNNAVTLTLTESGTTLVPANFTVTATASNAPEITLSTPGMLTIRPEAIILAGVVSSPPFTNPGGQVAISAQVEAAVNEPTQVLAVYTVASASGTVLFTSQPTPVSLSVGSTLTTAALGMLNTTGFALGTDTITVTLDDASGTPIPGASAKGTLVIGLPVTGTLTTTPSVVPTGTATATSTIQVNTGTSYPEPLTLQGAVSTPAPGTSVALYQSGGKTYAYESGTGGIDAINVTNPTNPQLIETFGQSDLVNGAFGFNVAKVVNGELLVGTSNGNNGSVFNLLVYSLANPAAPTLVSNTTIDYRFLADLLVNSTGTAAYVPTNGFFYSGSTIFQRFGDLVSVDLSNPTMPTLGSSLFTNEGQPDGGDMSEFGGTLVNDNIAYITGITPGGSNVTNDTGNLLVVNVADPKNMSVVTSLTIPGTINLLNLAVYGNRALVVGTAGAQSDVYNPNSSGVANNLTLTVLDITNPSSPTILGSTLVTNEQYPFGEAGAKTDVVSLGNGDFAVSDNDTNGKPSLLVVDPTDPNSIIVSSAQVPSGVHGITVSGNEVYATTSSGLSTYLIGPLVSDPVAITVNLPAGTAANIVPGSFNIPPTQINTSASGDSLVWDRHFSAGNTTYTFTWQTTLNNVTAGHTIPVTTGASLAFTSQGTTGTSTVPGTSVTGASIVSVTPALLTAPPGGSATYDVRLTNPTNASVTYTESVTNFLGDAVANLPFSVTVPAQGTVDEPLTFTPGPYTTPGTFPFTVSVEDGQNAASGTATATLTIGGTPIVQPDTTAHGIVVSLTPASATVGQGDSVQYVVQLTNTGSANDSFILNAPNLPTGVYANFSQNDIDVPPGASNFRDVMLTLSTYAGTTPGAVPFQVKATSASLPTVTGSASGNLTVVASGVQIFFDERSGAPGTRFTATVSNTGTVTDTFNLALAGPAALVATLGQNKVTLAPGASQDVTITTGAVNFAISGPLKLAVTATSQTNPAVKSDDTATLTIPSTQGLTAQLTPSAKVIPIPGTSSFLLLVNNTGNVQDSYTATIMGTSGPVTATLVGLDGLPTQTIPTFYLPGLSSGAIVLQTDLKTAGQGTVTVRVSSLTNKAMVASATAMITATASGITNTSTVLGISTTSSTFGQPVTFSAAIGVPPGVGTPTGTVTFRIDGVPQTPVTLQPVNGVAVATFTTARLAPGAHTITASYSGNASFSTSASSPVADTVSPATVTTALVATPNPSGPGRPVTFTAFVAGNSAAAPTGFVVFLDGTTTIGTATLTAGAATLSATLSPGTHTIRAVYGGDTNYAAEASPPLAQVVTTGDGPTVTNVQRFGYHAMPTSLVLTFSEPLDPARAQNVNNYQIVNLGGPGRDGNLVGQRIAVRSAIYNPTTLTVTLDPAQQLDVHNQYRLTVVGTAPNGLTDITGLLLDGAGTGKPGSNFVTVISRQTLAGPAPSFVPKVTPKVSPVAKPKPVPVAKPKPVPVAKPKPVPVAKPKPVPVAKPKPVPTVVVGSQWSKIPRVVQSLSTHAVDVLASSGRLSAKSAKTVHAPKPH